MSASKRSTGASGCRRWSHQLAVLALACSGGAFAQQVVSVPAAHLAHTEGTVAYAPQGDNEWHDVQPLRVLKRGDRLWTDRGSRAEVQAGGHALRLDGQTQLVLENASETATQLSLTQGSLAATVTRVNPGDSFEVGTPNLAFRARQPGDYRIDADPKQGITRIVVLSGSAVVYGEKGEALEVRTGQRITFRNRDLTRVQTPAFAVTDDFDRWVSARRRGEPTVSMPALAAARPAPSAPEGPVTTGRTIVIPGNGPAPAGKGALATAKMPAAKAAAAIAAAQPAPKLAPATSLTLPAAKAAAQAAPPARAIAAAAPAAAPLRVSAPDTPPGALVEPAVLPPRIPAVIAPPQPAVAGQAAAAAQAQAAAAQAAAAQAAAAKAQAAREARAEREARERERERVAQQRAERAQRDKRAALEARRADDHKRSTLAAKRAEEERRRAEARREQDQKVLAARRSEEERRHALARRAAEEKERKLAAARKAAEDLKLAETRKRQLARLQEQAAREEQAAQARREQQARRAEEDRETRDELARREEAERRQRALLEQARRDQERRDEEVWLRQQQPIAPARPVPMGVPFVRRVS